MGSEVWVPKESNLHQVKHSCITLGELPQLLGAQIDPLTAVELTALPGLARWTKLEGCKRRAS